MDEDYRKTHVCRLQQTWGTRLILALVELPMPYLRTLYGQRFFEDLYRQSFPIGLLLSVLAIPLALLGRGRVRLFSMLAASVVCWWWIVGLITD